MTHIYKGTLLFLGWLLCTIFLATPAQAQKENHNWNFGNQAGVSFATGSPVAVASSAMISYEGCASVSSSTGQLLMYSNGEQVWGANNQVMPNGASLGGHNSASQAALILPAPGSTTLYYLFTVDAIDTNLTGGLRYSIIDMSLRGGLGDVTATKSVRLPTPTLTGKVTEKLAAALHANGQDYWIVVHGWQSNVFYSFQLSAAGISTSPVASAAGVVHQGGGSFFGAGNAVGCLRISPNGTKLALAQRDTQFELYDFNNSTGLVSNYILIPPNGSLCYGVEFSPDNSRLYAASYTSGGGSSSLYQYNLLAGSATAIRASERLVGSISGLGVGIQAAPDGKIYLPVLNQSYLNSVEQPNALGTACGFRQNAVPLGQKLGQNCLPNFPNTFAVNTAAPTATFVVSPVCLGTASSFAASATPVLANTTYSWNFGEPGSGSANAGSGPTPTHTYSAAGTYSVTLSVALAGIATPVVVTQQVTVNALPVVNLGPATQSVCQGGQLTLSPGPQPAGTTYRWQNGFTTATLAATATGIYTVDVTSPAGCTTRASVRVEVEPLPVVNIVPGSGMLCVGQTVVLTAGSQPAGSTYRWQDGSTGSTFTVTKAGSYSLSVTSPLGCTAQSTTVIQYLSAPSINLGSATQQLCEGQSLTLGTGPQPAGSTYRWQDGSTNASYVARQAGTYSVTVTSPQGCTAQAATTVTVTASPSVQLGPDIKACLDQPVLLQANDQPAGTTYRWQDGSTARTFLAAGAGTYTLAVTTSAGCTSQDEIMVSDSGCPFEIPNIITPNSDKTNETFVLKGLNPKLWRLEIYNRWGRRIYQANSYDNQWDAAEQPAGVYYYLLTHTSSGQQHRGWVEVVR